MITTNKNLKGNEIKNAFESNQVEDESEIFLTLTTFLFSLPFMTIRKNKLRTRGARKATFIAKIFSFTKIRSFPEKNTFGYK